MANTQSFSFPNLFDVARNKVNIVEDGKSVTNRTKLLILSEPCELYNSPDFGVGLKSHMFQYNTENQAAIIKDKIVSQLKLYEPCVIADQTQFADGLVFSGNRSMVPDSIRNVNSIELTVALTCIFGDKVNVELNDK